MIRMCDEVYDYDCQRMGGNGAPYYESMDRASQFREVDIEKYSSWLKATNSLLFMDFIFGNWW